MEPLSEQAKAAIEHSVSEQTKLEEEEGQKETAEPPLEPVPVLEPMPVRAAPVVPLIDITADRPTDDDDITV